MLLGSVFISAVQGLCISAFGETSNILMKSFFLYWFGLNIMFIILSTLTYSIAYYSMRKSRKDVHQQPTGQEKKLKKHFFVPGIIIGTYCIFYSIPFTVHFRALMTGPYIIADDLDRKTTMISGCLGLLADPLAYIFLCKRYRKAFFKRMQKWFHVTIMRRTLKQPTQSKWIIYDNPRHDLQCRICWDKWTRTGLQIKWNCPSLLSLYSCCQRSGDIHNFVVQW